MKTFKIKDMEFKVREFIPYTEMGNINLFGIISTATKQSNLTKPYMDKNPKNDEESPEEYQLRINGLMTEEDKDKLKEISFSYITVMQPMLSALIITPKLSEISMGMGIQLQRHPIMTELIKDIMEDMKQGMEVSDDGIIEPKKE